jgi:hypothetical protein
VLTAAALASGQRFTFPMPDQYHTMSNKDTTSQRPPRWIVKLWDGFSSNELERFGTYEQVRNSCAGYPPGYIWSIEPA